jgi:hypothetical protein
VHLLAIQAARANEDAGLSSASGAGKTLPVLLLGILGGFLRPVQCRLRIVYTCSRPKAIGQMPVQNIDQINKSRSKVDTGDMRLYVNSGRRAVLQSGSDTIEGRTYSRQPLALNSDNVASITSDDRTTREDSLYGWALKINGVNVDTMLRNGVCSCDHPRQAEFCIDTSAIRTFGAEWVADNRNVRTWGNFIVSPEFQKRKTKFTINLQEGKITDHRILVDEDTSQWRRAVRPGNSDSAEPLTGLRIEDDMGSSQNPSISGDDEASCSAVCHVDADDSSVAV